MIETTWDTSDGDVDTLSTLPVASSMIETTREEAGWVFPHFRFR
jgi:hypothetical protein